MGNATQSEASVPPVGPDRATAMYGLASLTDRCGRYYAAHLKPIVRRLVWIVLFPDRCPATSRREWTIIARRIAQLVEDRRRPCTGRDTRTLRAVWNGVIRQCPYADIRRALERIDAGQNRLTR